MNDTQKKFLEDQEKGSADIEHSIYNSSTQTTIEINETGCENTCIYIKYNDNDDPVASHYLNLKDLDSLIDILCFVRDRKTKK